MIDRDLELLYEIGTMRHMPRGWIQHLGGRPASVLEHSVRVAFLALMLARKEGKGDPEIILKMALLHDLAEARISDLSYVQKLYVKADEDRAIHDSLKGTLLEDLEEVVKAYESKETIEAQLVKDADNLDIDLEMKELEEQGHTVVRKWKVNREKVRNEMLYTQAGKDVWDSIQNSDPSAWHLRNNKWFPES